MGSANAFQEGVASHEVLVESALTKLPLNLELLNKQPHKEPPIGVSQNHCI